MIWHEESLILEGAPKNLVSGLECRYENNTVSIVAKLFGMHDSIEAEVFSRTYLGGSAVEPIPEDLMAKFGGHVQKVKDKFCTNYEQFANTITTRTSSLPKSWTQY